MGGENKGGYPPQPPYTLYDSHQAREVARWGVGGETPLRGWIGLGDTPPILNTNQYRDIFIGRDLARGGLGGIPPDLARDLARELPPI